MKTLKDILQQASEPVAPLPTAEQKRSGRRAAEDTAGPGWYNMPAAKMTPELEAELRVLRMRNVVDPTRHYKSSERLASSKYLQVGTIVDDPTDFYSSKTHRTSRRAQKRSLVDALLRDEESRQYYKARFSQAQQRAQSGSHKDYQQGRNRLRKPWNRDTKTKRK